MDDEPNQRSGVDLLDLDRRLTPLLDREIEGGGGGGETGTDAGRFVFDSSPTRSFFYHFFAAQPSLLRAPLTSSVRWEYKNKRRLRGRNAAGGNPRGGATGVGCMGGIFN